MTSSLSDSPYPTVRRDDSEKSTLTYHSKAHGSVVVHDVYSPLESAPDQSEETKKFVEDQYSLSRTFLDTLPDRKQWYNLLKRSWNYTRFSALKREPDGRYYFEYNSGLQAQAVLYRVNVGEEDTVLTDSGPGGELFFDPNTLSDDGTSALTGYGMSSCGKYWVYGISEHGGDWMTLYIRKTTSPHPSAGGRGKDTGRLSDTVRYLRFYLVSWTKDSKGFFYSRYPAPEKDDGTEVGAAKDCKVYYHRIGDNQDQDTLVYEDPDHPYWLWSAEVTNNGKYLLLSASRDTSHTQFVKITSLEKNEIGTSMKWTTINDSWEARFQHIDADGSKIYFHTNYHAKNYQIGLYDFDDPTAGIVTLVQEDPESYLTIAKIHAGDKLVLIYVRDAKQEIRVHDLETGKFVERLFDDLIGVFTVFGPRSDNDIFIHYSGFVSPGTVYRYRFDADEGERRSLFRAVKIPGLDLDDFISESVHYKSKDGTRVHMFVTHLKDFERNGEAPALQYGYGGFAISMPPSFSVTILLFCKMYRGIYALAGIRGGLENGEEWHRDGMRDKKQNVFDDFIAASEWLVANKYAHKDRVAIRGGSNGGILSTACANQAPHLFRCVITIGGIMDMLRFPAFTFGALWVSEYGDPKDPEAFDYLYAYSPYHNICPAGTAMPAMIFFTSKFDDRAPPLHTFKHVAALQHRFKEQYNTSPIIMRVDMNSGHYAGKSTETMLQESADECSFIGASMGLRMIQLVDAPSN
ncbi:prolyl oligopeptidase [Cristinia sonorae]|uniref:Prolyl endopeptidase n=1 Tax=Cristinia sonorae TaxID=1940300 RepID=A0A8K0XT82_9AGAR|nr:prolyl oligopeptidase [Cristinia sonorae]